MDEWMLFNDNPSEEEAKAVKNALCARARETDWQAENALRPWDIALINAASKANPFFVLAFLYGAYVMISRRSKHSGDNHPYFNFVNIKNRRQGRSMKDVFLNLIDLKLARLTATDREFADDPQLDGWVDGGNYTYLGAGWYMAGMQPDTVIPPSDMKPGDEWRAIWPTVCVDLDGVLNLYAGWTGQYEHYEVRPGAREFLANLKEAGYSTVICTAQPDERLIEIEDWFISNGLRDLVYMITNQKPPAVAYLDDRAIRFDGDFSQALDALKGFKAFWQKKADGNA